MQRQLLLFSLFATLGMVGCATDKATEATESIAQATDWAQYQNDADLPEHVPNEIVIASKDGSIETLPFVQKMVSESSTQGLKKISGRLGVLSLKSSLSVVQFLKKMDQAQFHDQGVIAEPNYVFKASALAAPNDFFFDFNKKFAGTNVAMLWGAHRVKAQMSWQKGVTGKNVVVAVVDTGIGAHVDITPNMFTNTKEIANNGLDDDNNGFIDDIRGRDFVNNDNDANDDNLHGTHVAGTIAAAGDNTFGMIGIAPEVKLMPVKVLNAAGSGSLAGVAAGITYAADNGAKVINMSLGGPASNIVDNAVRSAVTKGVVVVVAAGNENQNTANVSPARVVEAVTVAATNPDDTKAGFSNFGTAVDVTAPGVNILSSLANGVNSNGIILDGNGNRHISIQGTSMASPHVAGVAALVRSANPALNPAEVEGILRSSAFDLGTPGRDDIFGNGMVDANGAVTAAQALINDPPVIAVEETADAFVGTMLKLKLLVTDPEGAPVTVTADNLPTGALFNAQANELMWTPTAAQAGQTIEVTFIATDGSSSVEAATSITVNTTSVNANNVSTNSVSPISCSVGMQDLPSTLGFFVLMLVVAAGIRKRRTFH